MVHKENKGKDASGRIIWISCTYGKFQMKGVELFYLLQTLTSQSQWARSSQTTEVTEQLSAAHQ